MQTVESFRTEALAFLERNAELRRGVGDWSNPAELLDPPQLAEFFERCTAWQRSLYEAGFAGISWPEHCGGRGLSTEHARAFETEMLRFDTTSGFLTSTISMVGTALLRHGTKEQQETLIPGTLAAEYRWCQLFSEPGAGSDLASLSTRAVDAEGGFLVTGQKVWSSMAHLSNKGFLLARTNPTAAKHHGISFLLVDMDAEGVDVRPLVQANGEAHFNEVFLDDVFVPADAIVGERDEGWSVTRTVMAAESQHIGSSVKEDVVQRLIELSRRLGKSSDPVVRQSLARCFSEQRVLGWMAAASSEAFQLGRAPSASGRLLKLANANGRVTVGNTACAILGPAAAAKTDEESGWAQQRLINRFGISIGGGTNEVQRNNIAERELGLPRELYES